MTKPAKKSMTLRLSDDTARRLEFVASVEDRSMSDLIRDAIDGYLEQIMQDPDTRQRLRESAREVVQWIDDLPDRGNPDQDVPPASAANRSNADD